MSVRNLTVRFGPVSALENVTLETPPGQITAVVGGDGAGKSTLLKAMVGLIPVTSGTVDTPDRPHIGYMPANAGSWADLSVDENVQFIGASYGLSGGELAQRADELLARAGLDSVHERLAGQLSGGMRNKLGFCLAMLHRPALLVLDEPSTGVDPVSRVELWRLITQAAAHGTAVVLSTTYMDEAERTGSVLVLDRGRALLSGTPDSIIAECPGVVVETDKPQRPRFAWRSGETFREWWPASPPPGALLAPLTLDDVAIVASLDQEQVA